MAIQVDIRTLLFLGRRVERLIFVGILIVVLCFIETYLTTANKQFTEDRSANTIASLLNYLKADEPKLTNLFQENPDANSKRYSSNNLIGRQKSINDTRKMLGLPPSLPSKSTDESHEPQTYKEAIDIIIRKLGNNPIEQRAEIIKYLDPTKSPKNLIQSLEAQKAEKEKVPMNVWGIQTPQILQVQYAGLDYKFPYGLASSILEIALAPLIVGWLGALYATRQRELLMLAALEDFKLAFPYILNFLPVNFQTLVTQSRMNTKISSIIMSFHRIVLSSFRTIVVLVIALPMVLCFAYSLFALEATANNEAMYLFYAGIAMAIVMSIQVLSIVIQEWTILRNKYFYE